MEKRKYIAPQITTASLLAKYHLTSGSINPVHETTSMFSRESSTWDDEEEEEENTGGWFQ